MNYTRDELMVALLAREIRDGELIFQGAASPMALVAIELARRTHARNASYLSLLGANPDPINMDDIMNFRPVKVTGYFNLFDLWDFIQKGYIDLEFIRPAQIDQYGNINNTVVGTYEKPSVRFPGGIAICDASLLIRRIVLYVTKHAKRTFVEKVDFVTARGGGEWRRQYSYGVGPARVITPLAVFGFEKDGRIKVDSIHEGVSRDELIQNTGFALEIQEETPTTKPPTEEEMRHISEIDPYGFRQIEFPELRPKVMAKMVEVMLAPK
jgi:glutaconate CoA-transferase subunit B